MLYYHKLFFCVCWDNHIILLLYYCGEYLLILLLHMVKFTSLVYMSFDKCIVLYLPLQSRYRPISSSQYSLILLLWSQCQSHLLSLAIIHLFFYLDNFTLTRMSYKWNHMVCSFWSSLISREIWDSSKLLSLSVFCPFFIDEWFSIVGMQHLLIHSPVEGHLGCFQLLAIWGKTTINVHI